MAWSLVSDDDGVPGVVPRAVAGEEHEVCATPAGKETLDALTGAQFDLLFTDLANAKILGTALIEKVTCRFSELPVVVWSASNSDGIISEISELGVRASVVKPPPAVRRSCCGSQ